MNKTTKLILATLISTFFVIPSTLVIVSYGYNLTSAITLSVMAYTVILISISYIRFIWEDR